MKEWLWPLGFYLEAKLKFNSDHKHTIVAVKHILSKHFEHLESSDWFGLPELTNSDGKPCSGSCPIQSWSHSTILQVLHLIDVIDSSFV
jgi:glycogen debranching enzyme